MSTFLRIQKILPYLRKQKDSAIVNISSYTAYEPTALIVHYAIVYNAIVAEHREAAMVEEFG